MHLPLSTLPILNSPEAALTAATVSRTTSTTHAAPICPHIPGLRIRPVTVELEMLARHVPGGLVAFQLGDSLPVLQVLLIDALELGLVFEDLIFVAGSGGALLVGENLDVPELGDDVHFVLDQLLSRAGGDFVLADPLVLGVETFFAVFDFAARGLWVFERAIVGGLLQGRLVHAHEQMDLGEQGEECLSDGHDGEKMRCERRDEFMKVM